MSNFHIILYLKPPQWNNQTCISQGLREGGVTVASLGWREKLPEKSCYYALTPQQRGLLFRPSPGDPTGRPVSRAYQKCNFLYCRHEQIRGWVNTGIFLTMASQRQHCFVLAAAMLRDNWGPTRYANCPTLKYAIDTSSSLNHGRQHSGYNAFIHAILVPSSHAVPERHSQTYTFPPLPCIP